MTQSGNSVNSKVVNRCRWLSRAKQDHGLQRNGSTQPKGSQGQGVWTSNHGYNGLSYLCLLCGIFFLIPKILQYRQFGKHIKVHRKTKKTLVMPSSRNNTYWVVFSVLLPKVTQFECTRGSMLKWSKGRPQGQLLSSNSSPTS